MTKQEKESYEKKIKEIEDKYKEKISGLEFELSNLDRKYGQLQELYLESQIDLKIEKDYHNRTEDILKTQRSELEHYEKMFKFLTGDKEC